MTTYHASSHAVDRLLERYPDLAPVAGAGNHAAVWLGRATRRARMVGQQRGADLMLGLDLPLTTGTVTIYLPVTPHASGDTWTIRTVLTEEQGRASLAKFMDEHRDRHRATWRSRKGFTRPWRRASLRTQIAWQEAA